MPRGILNLVLLVTITVLLFPMHAVALAPPSNINDALQATDELSSRKPQIVTLLPDKPNPKGLFFGKVFDATARVFVDFRPKQAGGIGDQLLYTPLLLAFLERFPGLRIQGT